MASLGMTTSVNGMVVTEVARWIHRCQIRSKSTEQSPPDDRLASRTIRKADRARREPVDGNLRG